MNIFSTTVFVKKSSKLMSPLEIQEFETELAMNPEKWPLVQGTGGIRKARASRGGFGKSGGVRILYFFQLNRDTIFLMDIYAKNDKENLSDSDKKVLKELVKAIKGGM